MMWGSAPRPGRGLVPCTPFVGAPPQEDYSFNRHSALGLCTHLGLRPKPRASCLARGLLLLKMKLAAAGVPPPLIGFLLCVQAFPPEKGRVQLLKQRQAFLAGIAAIARQALEIVRRIGLRKP